MSQVSWREKYNDHRGCPVKETAENTRQLSANLCYRSSVGTFLLEMLAGQGTKPLGFWVFGFCFVFFFLVTFPLIASPLHSLKKEKKHPTF